MKKAVKKIICLIMFLCVFCCVEQMVSASETEDMKEQQEQSEPIRILFIGNSFTQGSRGSVGMMLEEIAEAQGKTVECKEIAHGSAHLSYYAQPSEQYESYYREVMSALLTESWDYIVLQGHSKESIENLHTSLYSAVNTLKANINCFQPSAKILLYMTHGYDNGTATKVNGIPRFLSTLKMQQYVQAAYTFLEDRTGLEAVPAGMYFMRGIMMTPDLELFDYDEKHPNEAGYYLLACAFYKSVFKENPDYSADVDCGLTVSEQEQLCSLVFGEATLDRKYKVLKEGQSFDLNVTASDGSAVSWTNLNSAVASVKAGKVTAKKEGETGIIAKTSSGLQAACWVKVENANLYSKGLIFKTSNYTVNQGDTIHILPQVSGLLKDVKLKWSSGNKNVATVTSAGIVSVKQPGKVTISVQDTVSQKKASYLLYVKMPTTKINSVKNAGYSKSKENVASLKISWKKGSGAKGYTVYRSTSKNGTYKFIGSTTKNYFIDKNVTMNKTYYYKVRINHKYSQCDSAMSSSVRVMVPQKSSVKVVKQSKKAIQIRWNKNAKASGYIVYRSTKEKKGYKKIAKIDSGKKYSYTDTKVKKGVTYYYRVRVYFKKGDNIFYSRYSDSLKVRAASKKVKKE